MKNKQIIECYDHRGLKHTEIRVESDPEIKGVFMAIDEGKGGQSLGVYMRVSELDALIAALVAAKAAQKASVV